MVKLRQLEAPGNRRWIVDFAETNTEELGSSGPYLEFPTCTQINPIF